MEKICKNCKYWEHEVSNIGTNHCKHPNLYVADEDVIPDPFPSKSLIASDSWGEYGSGIYTAPDFGCVNFEEKPISTLPESLS